jgi:hypothetical protein
MAYATNPGNLRLQLTDLGGELPPVKAETTAPSKETKKKEEETELEIE